MAFWKSQQGSVSQFPPANGTVGGVPAYVQQSGDRTVGYHGRDNVGKIVSNDGLNASFVRDDSGEAYVDDSRDNPYEPYQQNPERY